MPMNVKMYLGTANVQQGSSGTFLVADLNGDGQEEIVQCFGSHSGLIVYRVCGLQVVAQWGSENNGVPSGSRWLAGQFVNNSKSQLVQLGTTDDGFLGMTMFGVNADDQHDYHISLLSGINLKPNGPDAIHWLVGHFRGSERQEIAQCFGDEQLGIVLYGVGQSGALEALPGGSANVGDVAAGMFAVGDVDGDGIDEIVQVHRTDDNTPNPQTRIIVYKYVNSVMTKLSDQTLSGWPLGSLCYVTIAKMLPLASFYDPRTQHLCALLSQVNSDGSLRYVVQVLLSTGPGGSSFQFTRIVNTSIAAGSYAQDAVQFMTGDFCGTGLSSVACCYGQGGDYLKMLIMGTDVANEINTQFQSDNMGQGPSAVGWLVGQFDMPKGARGATASIWQGWANDNDDNNLGMLFYRASPPAEKRETGDGEKLLLLKKYAPKAWLAKDERYFPSSVDSFLSSGEVQRIGGEDSKYWIETIDPVRVGYYTRALFAGETDLSRVPIYAFWVDKGWFVDLVYFFYYPFNEGKFGVGYHVSDWEHFTVRLFWTKAEDGPVFEPVAAYYSWHAWGMARGWQVLEKTKDDGRPVVYIAKGSHGVWYAAGTNYYLGLLADSCSKGTEWDTWNNVKAYDYSKQTSLDEGGAWPKWMSTNYDATPGVKASDVDGPIWRWGNPQEGEGLGGHPLEDGPTGPADKAAVWNIMSFA